jgi:hypothetical protein
LPFNPRKLRAQIVTFGTAKKLIYFWETARRAWSKSSSCKAAGSEEGEAYAAYVEPYEQRERSWRAFSTGPLLDQHGVAVAVEAVSLFDGFMVGSADYFTSGKGGDEHDEGGSGKVEVGEHGIHHFKFITWGDK